MKFILLPLPALPATLEDRHRDRPIARRTGSLADWTHINGSAPCSVWAALNATATEEDRG
jgi:hypothetical protein